MKCYVINLPSASARWENVARQFDAVGLTPIRFDATVGRNLDSVQTSLHYSASLNARQYYKPLNAGEIGCYFSHIRLWQAFIKSNDRLIAVFEDDVDLSSDLPSILSTIESRTVDWDMIKLIGRTAKKEAARWPLLTGRSLVLFKRVPSLTSAYVISRQGAEKLLAGGPVFGRPIDVDLRHWWERDLIIQGVYPYPVAEAESSLISTINPAGQRIDKHRLKKWAFKLRYWARNSIENMKISRLKK